MFKYLRQLASESVIYGLSGVVTRFVGLFLVPVYTRVFAPADYGVIGLVTTTMSLVGTFVVLGLDNATIRWYWDTEDLRDRKSSVSSWIWCQIAVSLLFALAMIALSGWLADEVVHRPDARLYYILAAVSLPFNTWGIVVTNWLRLQRRAWTTVAFSLGVNLAGIATALLFVVGLKWGLLGIYMSQVLVALLSAAGAILILKDWAHPRHFRRERLGAMLRYALPLIPTGIAVWVISVSDRYFVQYYRTTGEVGLYQIAGSIAMGMGLLTTAFQQAWSPFAMSIYKQKDAAAVYARVFLVGVWFFSLLGTGLSLLTPELIRILATQRYAGASSAVPYLVFGYIMLGLYNIAAIGPSIAKETRLVGAAFAIAAVVNTSLNFLLIPGLGKEGAAISTLVSYAILPVYVFYRSRHIYSVPYRFGAAGGIFALSFALLLALHGWHPQSLWIGVAGKLAVLFVFVPAAFAFKVVTVKQVRQLLNKRFAESVA